MVVIERVAGDVMIGRRRSGVLLFVAFALVFILLIAFDGGAPMSSAPVGEAPHVSSAHAPTQSDRVASELSAHHVERAVTAALHQCRSQTEGRECALLRSVTITREGILVPRQLNREFASMYPSGHGTLPFQKTRQFQRPVRVIITDRVHSDGAVQMPPGSVAVYQTIVPGAGYVNVWHTLGDFYLTLLHTVGPLLREGVLPVWVSEAAATTLSTHRNACASLEHCRRLPLFHAFDELFGGRVMFAAEGISSSVLDVAGSGSVGSPVRFDWVLFGLNNRCSPIPDVGIEAPICRAPMQEFRSRLLAAVGLDERRTVTQSELLCPSVHLMSRQGDRYRHVHNWPVVVDALRASFAERGCDPALVHVIKLTGRMSLTEQIRSIWNSTILVAGRGGGTAYSPLLPRGGAYLSISGSDRWSPYRKHVPSWIRMAHFEATMTHEDSPRLPPRRFKKGLIDANRCAYLIEKPHLLVKAFWDVVDVLRGESHVASLTADDVGTSSLPYNHQAGGTEYSTKELGGSLRVNGIHREGDKH